MAQEKLNVGVVGVGPVGTIMALFLAKAEADVTVVDLPHRIAQVNESGLQVQWGETPLQHRVRALDSISALSGLAPEYIVVATKTYSLEKVLPQVAEVAGDNCLVISAQNGIGTEDEFMRYLYARNVARMVVNYAGNCDERGVARLNWFNPPNLFGLFSEHRENDLKRLVDALTSVGLTSEMLAKGEIKPKAFLKTILTSALMPLCAVMKLTMQEAMEGRATRQLAGEVLREGLAVAARRGHKYPENIWELCMGYLDRGGKHHPSMSIDIMNKRPTEIDFINGKILERGHGLDDLPLEVNRVLTYLLMSLEVKNGTRGLDEFPDHLFPVPASLPLEE